MSVWVSDCECDCECEYEWLSKSILRSVFRSRSSWALTNNKICIYKNLANLLFVTFHFQFLCLSLTTFVSLIFPAWTHGVCVMCVASRRDASHFVSFFFCLKQRCYYYYLCICVRVFVIFLIKITMLRNQKWFIKFF